MNKPMSKDVIQEGIDEMEKELALWQSFLVLNQGQFTPQQVAGSLRRAKEIVNELLLANATE